MPRLKLNPDMQAVIDRCIEVRPDILEGAISLPHTPTLWAQVYSNGLPFCGCFIGSLAIVAALEDDDEISESWPDDLLFDGRVAYAYVASKLRMHLNTVWSAGVCCDTTARDALAVAYARQELRKKAAAAEAL